MTKIFTNKAFKDYLEEAIKQQKSKESNTKETSIDLDICSFSPKIADTTLYCKE